MYPLLLLFFVEEITKTKLEMWKGLKIKDIGNKFSFEKRVFGCEVFWNLSVVSVCNMKSKIYFLDDHLKKKFE